MKKEEREKRDLNGGEGRKGKEIFEWRRRKKVKRQI